MARLGLRKAMGADGKVQAPEREGWISNPPKMIRMNGKLVSMREMRKEIDRTIFIPAADRQGLGMRSIHFIDDRVRTDNDFLDDLHDGILEFAGEEGEEP